MFLIPVKVPSHIVFLPPYSFTLEHPQIIKYFKGVYNLRPPTPITFAWDVKIMLNYFSHKGENDQLSDKSLTQRLLILLLLLWGQRMSTAYFFTVDRMIVTDIGVTYLPNYVPKHSKPGKKLDNFHYRACYNKKLCAADCLKEYLKRHNTKLQNDAKALFRAGAIDSMKRWVKELFIETSILKEYTHRNVYSERIHTTHL